MKRREWLAEVQNNQRNIAPQDTIRNDALVETLLIRGDKPLTRVQRIAAILFSVLWFSASGIVWFADLDIARDLHSNPKLVFPVLLIALVATAFAYIGFRMAWNGIVGGRKVRRRS